MFHLVILSKKELPGSFFNCTNFKIFLFALLLYLIFYYHQFFCCESFMLPFPYMHLRSSDIPQNS